MSMRTRSKDIGERLHVALATVSQSSHSQVASGQLFGSIIDAIDNAGLSFSADQRIAGCLVDVVVFADDGKLVGVILESALRRGTVHPALGMMNDSVGWARSLLENAAVERVFVFVTSVGGADLAKLLEERIVVLVAT